MMAANRAADAQFSGAPPVIDLTIEAGDWESEARLRQLADAACRATVSILDPKALEASELSLLFTDDAHIRKLNDAWRGNDNPTNVLSFPAFEMAPGDPLPPMLGDIVIANETILREAALDSKPFDHHLTHMIVHGFLHLLGYDHETDNDAEVMETLERRILASLAIADPYAPGSGTC